MYLNSSLAFRLEFLWRWMPVLVVAMPLPKHLIGISLGPLILVKPGYFLHRPTIEHELEHSRQSWRGLLVGHLLAYWCSRRYRLRAEAKAFAVELRHYDSAARDSHLAAASTALARCYGLSISEDVAAASIQRRI